LNYNILSVKERLKVNFFQKLGNFIFIFQQLESIFIFFQDFSIAAKTSYEHTQTSSCPSGKKVLGCSVRDISNNVEVWKSSYPSDDGTSCNCYGYYGAE
jgi:hypothetical protein